MDRDVIGLRMCDLAAFGDTIQDAKVRVRAISERINAIKGSVEMQRDFEKEFKMVLRRRDEKA